MIPRKETPTSSALHFNRMFYSTREAKQPPALVSCHTVKNLLWPCLHPAASEQPRCCRHNSMQLQPQLRPCTLDALANCSAVASRNFWHATQRCSLLVPQSSDSDPLRGPMPALLQPAATHSAQVVRFCASVAPASAPSCRRTRLLPAAVAPGAAPALPAPVAAGPPLMTPPLRGFFTSSSWGGRCWRTRPCAQRRGARRWPR